MKKLLEANTAHGRRRISQVFTDFCELGALTLRNSVDRHGWDVREARYLQIASGYEREELDRFAELLAQVALELGNGFDDVLGHLYMSLDLGNERLGQFFSPYEVSLLSAQLALGNNLDDLRDQDVITLGEPSCGSGGMVIAMIDTLKRADINHQQRVHVTAQDLDATAVHMTYIHLALLHQPALVVHGNTLTLEQYDVWPTPAHLLNGWDARLRGHDTAVAAKTA